jgi:protein-L-isoaspartate(D-aspartate) O-methyltransferase
LIDQLEDGGFVVVPIGEDPEQDQTLVRAVRRGDKLEREEHGTCRFVPLLGRYGWNR